MRRINAVNHTCRRRRWGAEPICAQHKYTCNVVGCQNGYAQDVLVSLSVDRYIADICCIFSELFAAGDVRTSAVVM